VKEEINEEGEDYDQSEDEKKRRLWIGVGPDRGTMES
jgi:hypothetical protein